MEPNLLNKLLSKRSIRQKIMIPLMVMVLLVFFVVLAVDYQRRLLDSEVRLKDKLESSSHLANLVLANALWNYNDEIITDLADAIMEDEEVVFMSIRTKSGIVYFERISPVHQENSDWTSLMDREIFYDGESIGIVRIGVTSLIQQRILFEDMTRTLTFVALLMVLMASMIAYIGRVVTKPIELLEKEAEEIAKGNFGGVIPIDTQDEIGRLAEKFNIMSRNLSDTILELDESKEKYSKAFKNLAEVVGLLRLSDQRFVEINDAFCQVLGYKVEEVVGRRSTDFDLWFDLHDREAFYKTFNQDGKVHNMECRWLTKDRMKKVGLVSAELIDIAGIQHELFIWSDITALKEKEAMILESQKDLEVKVQERTAELREASAQLVEAEKMASLGSLVSGIAHEINTPIGICVTSISYLNQEIRQLAEKQGSGILKKSDFNDFIEQASSLGQILLSNLRRADKLIVSFKNIAVDKTSEELREIEMRTYLEQIILSLSPLLKGTRHTIKMTCEPDIYLNTYPGALAQIITNLVTNSLNHGFEDIEQGHIVMSFESNGGNHMLHFKDDGIGIPLDIQKRIYDPFFTTKRGNRGGTGLGLHIVYNIVTQQLEGSIICDSTPGLGTEFIVRFNDLQHTSDD